MAARKTKRKTSRRRAPHAEVGDMIDQLYLARARRLELKATLNTAANDEKELAEKIMGLLNQAKLAGGKGGVASFTKNPKRRVKPVLGKNGEPDWKKTFAWIAKNKAWDMLYKRMIDGAVLDRIDDGVKVPVTVEPYMDYTLTKIS